MAPLPAVVLVRVPSAMVMLPTARRSMLPVPPLTVMSAFWTMSLPEFRLMLPLLLVTVPFWVRSFAPPALSRMLPTDDMSPVVAVVVRLPLMVWRMTAPPLVTSERVAASKVTAATVSSTRLFVSSMKIPPLPMLAARVVMSVFKCWAALPLWEPLMRSPVAVMSVSVVPLSVILPMAVRLTLPVVAMLPMVMVVPALRRMPPMPLDASVPSFMLMEPLPAMMSMVPLPFTSTPLPSVSVPSVNIMLPALDSKTRLPLQPVVRSDWLSTAVAAARPLFATRLTVRLISLMVTPLVSVRYVPPFLDHVEMVVTVVSSAFALVAMAVPALRSRSPAVISTAVSAARSRMLPTVAMIATLPVPASISAMVMSLVAANRMLPLLVWSAAPSTSLMVVPAVRSMVLPAALVVMSLPELVWLMMPVTALRLMLPEALERASFRTMLPDAASRMLPTTAVDIIDLSTVSVPPSRSRTRLPLLPAEVMPSVAMVRSSASWMNMSPVVLFSIWVKLATWVSMSPLPLLPMPFLVLR